MKLKKIFFIFFILLFFGNLSFSQSLKMICSNFNKLDEMKCTNLKTLDKMVCISYNEYGGTIYECNSISGEYKNITGFGPTEYNNSKIGLATCSSINEEKNEILSEITRINEEIQGTIRSTKINRLEREKSRLERQLESLDEQFEDLGCMPQIFSGSAAFTDWFINSHNK